MRWTQPLEHLSIIFIFVIVGFLMNFLQFGAFLVFWHLNRGFYRDLVHVRYPFIQWGSCKNNFRRSNLAIGRSFHGLDFIIRAQN